jgi:hypothetical protein
VVELEDGMTRTVASIAEQLGVAVPVVVGGEPS